MSWPDGKTFVRDTCKHFPYGIDDDHVNHFRDCDCKVLLVGEAPGSRENAKGRPFIGPAGYLLDDELLQPVGLSHNDCYITNAIAYQPPANDMGKAWGMNANVVAAGMSRAREVATHSKCRVIVPMGNTALQAIANRRGILKWRGSVLQDVIANKFVVATIHPAAVLRQHILVKTCRYDWTRIKEIVDNGRFDVPAINLIGTTHNDKRLRSLFDSRVLFTDIETIRATSRVLCVSFCGDGITSYSVDCRFGIPSVVRELLESNIPKGLQNGLFDLYILALNDIRVRRFVWDTSLMFHALDNNVGPTSASIADGKSTIKPYSLGYMASIFTPFTFWKDSAKDSGEGESYDGKKTKWERFQDYNAMDSLGTYWIGRTLKQHLAATGRLEHYKQHYAALLYPLLALSLRGVRFDVERARTQAAKLEEALHAYRDNVSQAAGTVLHKQKVFKNQPKLLTGRKDGLIVVRRDDGVYVGNGKSISNNALKTFLYDRLKVKKFSKDGKVTTDEVALRRIQIWLQDNVSWRGDRNRAAATVAAVLQFRETEKTLQFLKADAVDSDGRIRAAYSLLTQSGRLRSSGNPTGTGYNLQNTQRNIRHFFLPDVLADDEPTYFLEVDLKQAEDLVVKALSSYVTGDSRPMELVRAVWDGSIDIHKRLASATFSVPQSAVTGPQRYVAKRCRHGKNNGMKEGRMQWTLLKDGFPMTFGEVKRVFAAIDAAEPWVPEFHKAIRRNFMREKRIVTSWGWMLDVHDDRITDNSTFNRGYCFIEQSEVGVLMKQWGLLTYANEIEPHFRARLNMLVHDNVVLSVPRSELYDVATILYSRLTRSRAYKIRSQVDDDDGAVSLAIPAEIKVSRTLSCSCDDCKRTNVAIEFAKLPDRETFYKEIEKWETILT